MELDRTPWLDWASAQGKAHALELDWAPCLDWATAQGKAPAMELEIPDR